jgi:hypothetical protein
VNNMFLFFFGTPYISKSKSFHVGLDVENSGFTTKTDDLLGSYPLVMTNTAMEHLHQVDRSH